MGRLEDLDHFYALLGQLADQTRGPRLLTDETIRDDLPKRGVYFFFEPGELREDGRTPRVVRVGTHAVSAGSRTTLWTRLRDHRGHVIGRHADGGNHRASIFRRHVGSALLSRGIGTLVPSWGEKHRSKDEHLREAEHLLEVGVSGVIRAMPFLWLAVNDPPGKESDRKVIEANAIGLLSNQGRPSIDAPTPEWLGHWAGAPEIRESGLWNVDHVKGGYDAGFLALIASYITTGSATDRQ